MNRENTDRPDLRQLAADVLNDADIALEGEPSLLVRALNWIERQTYTRTNHAQMLVGLREGLFLKNFVCRTSSRRILEIGTFTGYSLACLADGVISKGRTSECYVDAIEINKELDYIIEEGLCRAGVSELVKVFFCDAVSLLKHPASLQDVGAGGLREYDLIFIDADKRQYPQYYELVLPLLKPGGYILADNVSWYGKGAQDVQAGHTGKMQKTSGIVSFNRLVENDTRVESFFLDIRDGLYIIRKI